MYIAGGAREPGCEVRSATAMATAGIANETRRDETGRDGDGRPAALCEVWCRGGKGG